MLDIYTLSRLNSNGSLERTRLPSMKNKFGNLLFLRLFIMSFLIALTCSQDVDAATYTQISNVSSQVVFYTNRATVKLMQTGTLVTYDAIYFEFDYTNGFILTPGATAPVSIVSDSGSHLKVKVTDPTVFNNGNSIYQLFAFTFSPYDSANIVNPVISNIKVYYDYVEPVEEEPDEPEVPIEPEEPDEPVDPIVPEVIYTDLNEFLNSTVQLDLYQYHVLKRLEFIQYAFCIVIALLFFNLLRKN